MSANNLDRQPEERLITEIREMKRQLSELRTLQNQGTQAIMLNETEAYEYEAVVPSAAGFNTFTVDSWLYNPNGLPLFAIHFSGFFIGSSEVRNDFQYTVIHNPFVFEAVPEFAGAIRQSSTFVNNSGSQKTIKWRSKWRYIVASGVQAG